jgi:hypothetical protein
MTTSKITVQRQGKYERFILHIPAALVSGYGLHGKYLEWSVNDNDHLTVVVHSRPGPGSTAITVNKNASGDHHRVSVPKALAEAIGLRGASVEWGAKGLTVFILTVIRLTITERVTKKKEAKTWKEWKE